MDAICILFISERLCNKYLMVHRIEGSTFCKSVLSFLPRSFLQRLLRTFFLFLSRLKKFYQQEGVRGEAILGNQCDWLQYMCVAILKRE